MARSEIDELIGSDDPSPRQSRIEKARHTVYATARARKIMEEDPAVDRTADLDSIKEGVTVTWLSNLYGVARKTIETRLGGCPILRRSKSGAPIYDLTVAAGYISGRKHDVLAALKVAKEEDFPLPMQQRFWKTKLLRNQWEADAGQLWRTEQVLDVFADTFKLMKDTMMLWVDNLDAAGTVTKEQRAFMVSQVDSLSRELHRKLVEMPARRKTVSLRDQELPEINRLIEGGEVETDDE